MKVLATLIAVALLTTGCGTGTALSQAEQDRFAEGISTNGVTPEKSVWKTEEGDTNWKTVAWSVAGAVALGTLVNSIEGPKRCGEYNEELEQYQFIPCPGIQ